MFLVFYKLKGALDSDETKYQISCFLYQFVIVYSGTAFDLQDINYGKDVNSNRESETF